LFVFCLGIATGIGIHSQRGFRHYYLLTAYLLRDSSFMVLHRRISFVIYCLPLMLFLTLLLLRFTLLFFTLLYILGRPEEERGHSLGGLLATDRVLLSEN
jgi:hypothetical protein